MTRSNARVVWGLFIVSGSLLTVLSAGCGSEAASSRDAAGPSDGPSQKADSSSQAADSSPLAADSQSLADAKDTRSPDGESPLDALDAPALPDGAIDVSGSGAEVAPDANAEASSDGQAYSYLGATFLLQQPQGLLTGGKSVQVSTEGPAPTITVAVPPTGALSDPAPRSWALSATEVEDLFARLSRVNASQLPNLTVPERGCRLQYRLSGFDSWAVSSYFSSSDLPPEMESVWQWFDTHLAGTDALLARQYCGG